MAISREQVMTALRSIVDPQRHADIVALGAASDIRLDGSEVYLTLNLATLSNEAKETARQRVESALHQAGASDVHITLTATPPAGPRHGAPAGTQPGPRHGAPTGTQPAAARPLPQVKHIVAVGAGKGGVGKSTLAVNLAVGLARAGAEVGLMDGDIYGPSMPTLLGIRGQAPRLQGNQLLPFHVHGIHAVTIGALVEQDKPLIWRGPMAHGAFKQLLLDNTLWPALDYLIVDLPPGTGDVPLSLCQMLAITGAVVVATPQQVALDDAVRAVRMFQQLEAPVLGIVENMSYFLTPDGQEHDIFGRGGAERAARDLGLRFLGSIPMFTELRVNSDAGQPLANFAGSPRLREALDNVVANLSDAVEQRAATTSGPTLTIH